MDTGADEQDIRRPSAKSAAAFRTISEVGREIDVPQHVLRFWESKFSQIRPLKRGGGRRYYRPEDVVLLRRIRELLYTDGYTIKGVQKLFRESGLKAVLDGSEARAEHYGTAADEAQAPTSASVRGGDGMTAVRRSDLEDLLAELVSLRGLLQTS